MIRTCLILCLFTPIYSFENLFDIQKKLWNGEIVKLENVFDVPIDNDPDLNYVLQVGDGLDDNADFYRYVSPSNDLLDTFKDNILEKATFFTELLFINDFNFETLTYTKYNESCYLESHHDYHIGLNPQQKQYHQARLLSIIYYTSDYMNNCGGELVWNGEFPYKEIKPEKNTMYLFIPREHSFHRIKDVKCGSRHAISGWLTSNRPSDTFLQMHHIMEYKKNNIP